MKPVSPITRRARQVALDQLDRGRTPSEAREFLRQAHYNPALVQNAVAWALHQRPSTAEES